MTRTPVKSSMLKSIGFENGILEAEFSNGNVYAHEGITQEQFDALMAADSIGGYFNRQIRQSCTSCRLIAPEKKQDSAAAVEAVG